jgi:AcrR family transcriptional regulator
MYTSEYTCASSTSTRLPCDMARFQPMSPSQQRRSPTERPTPDQGRRLPRAERREQILDAATRAFARDGYAATNLEAITVEAGISRMILYRHFESKAQLYLAVLDRVMHHLIAVTGAPDFTQASVDALFEAASQDPDGFRLLFHHASREPEFRAHTEQFTAGVFDVSHRHLAAQIRDTRWAAWAASLVPVVVIEAAIAWLDAGQPEPAEIGNRVLQIVSSIVDAAAAGENG